MKKRKLTQEDLERFKQRHPLIPDYAIPITKNVSSNSSNELTANIIDYINYNGGFAWRNNTQGNYNEKLKKWVTSGALKGVSDILCCYNGNLITIEVKRGYDKLNPHQIKFKTRIESTKGKFWEVRSLDEFLTKWKDFTNAS